VLQTRDRKLRRRPGRIKTPSGESPHFATKSRSPKVAPIRLSSLSPIEAAGAAIFDDGDRLVLLIKENYDRRRWGFPGGALEPGETPEQAVVREAREETGLEVRVESLVGSYSLADSSLVAHLFRCAIVAGTPAVPGSGESPRFAGGRSTCCRSRRRTSSTTLCPTRSPDGRA
jgi:ADP-ribose pyrophosphatase YjhB (NUDIX family)